MMVDKQGYVVRRYTKQTKYISGAVHEILPHPKKKLVGIIPAGKICFPENMIGTRIRFRIILEDDKE